MSSSSELDGNNTDGSLSLPQEQYCFIRLYQDEIYDSLMSSDSGTSAVFHLFDGFIDPHEIEQYLEAISVQSDGFYRYLQKKGFFARLFSTTEGTEAVVKVLREKDPPLLSTCLSVFQSDAIVPSLPKFREYFMRDDPFFLDLIASTLQVNSFLPEMKRVGKPEYANLLQALIPFENQLRSDVTLRTFIDQRLISKEVDHRQLARVFLRNLPFCDFKKDSDDWVYDLVKLMRECPMNRALLSVFMPKYREIFEQRRLQQLEKDRMIKGRTVTEKLAPITECRPQSENCGVTRANWKKMYLEESDPLNESEKQLRTYQHELAEKAVHGQNTVIVAPTGSGKTFVAAYIAKHHFEQSQREKRPARIAFIVPKIPLVEQQVKAFNEFLRYRYLVVGLHGGSFLNEETRSEYILGADITVLTPQILVNMLHSVRRDDRVYLCDFTMIMLDECHHTNKESAYNILMDHVHDYQYKKPQVVGFTASLGIQSNMQSDSAKEDIFKLLASMNSVSLSTVVRHKDDLDMHVVLPEDKVDSAKRPAGDKNRFYGVLTNFMKEVEVKIMPSLKKLVDASSVGLKENSIAIDRAIRCLSRYSSMVANLTSIVTQLNSTFDDVVNKTELLPQMEFLKICCSALAINDIMPASYALDYFNETLKQQFRGKQLWFNERLDNGIRDQMKNAADSERVMDKEIIHKLVKHLDEQLETKPESRVIIFVTMRQTAIRLCDFINKFDGLKRYAKRGGNLAGFVTSSQSKARLMGGQSQQEQRQTIDDFNKGNISIMVATSVAEEGLDVQTCNLIIKYNNTGNTVSEVQRRGRARAADSKSILLVIDDAVEQKELQNRFGEVVMKKCMKDINKMSIQEVEREAVKHQKSRKAERDERERQEMLDKQRLKDVTMDILCAGCNTILCSSSELRTVGQNNYVICKENIWDLLDFIPKSKQKSIGDLTLIVGDAVCNRSESGKKEDKCGRKLCKIIKYAEVYLPQLSITDVLFDNEGESVQIKKWANARQEHFYVEEIEEDELLSMKNALSIEKEETLMSAYSSIMMEAAAEEKRQRVRREKVERAGGNEVEWDNDETSSPPTEGLDWTD